MEAWFEAQSNFIFEIAHLIKNTVLCNRREGRFHTLGKLGIGALGQRDPPTWRATPGRGVFSPPARWAETNYPSVIHKLPACAPLPSVYYWSNLNGLCAYSLAYKNHKTLVFLVQVRNSMEGFPNAEILLNNHHENQKPTVSPIFFPLASVPNMFPVLRVGLQTNQNECHYSQGRQTLSVHIYYIYVVFANWELQILIL